MFRLIIANERTHTTVQIIPTAYDMPTLWRGGWRIIDYVHRSAEDLSQFNDWLSAERDYLARLQQQTLDPAVDLSHLLRNLHIPHENSSSDRYVTEPVKDGDSQKTQATSSKARNTFKAFIQRTMSTAS